MADALCDERCEFVYESVFESQEQIPETSSNCKICELEYDHILLIFQVQRPKKSR